MPRKSPDSGSAPVSPGWLVPSLHSVAVRRTSVQPAVERAIAVGYGLTYDAIVRGFEPYEALLDEVVALCERGAQPGAPAATRVLDV